MTDEITGNIVGREALIGREAAIVQCAESAKFRETVSATLTKLKISRVEALVVVEAAAQFLDRENQVSSVAS
jgi:hypothetical protein